MSTIYSDAAGNKYLGDCRWGNHDINYPTTNYLKAIDDKILRTTFLSDMLSLFTDAGWGNINVPQTWNTTANQIIFSATVPGASSGNNFAWYTNTSAPTYYNEVAKIGSTLSYSLDSNDGTLYNKNFDYVVSIGPNSLAFKPVYYRNNYTTEGTGLSQTVRRFNYWGKLVNVNTNFNYYSASFNNQVIFLDGTTYSASSVSTLNGDVALKARHYIVGAAKDLLQTGRAIYTISCSDGQTPGAQWATDMWVYDNNAALGYPVIGRVPNMLLGIGTYTYLKPVKIQGSVFPDNGSPWYLPVGTFSGKVLLMRCYSSVT